MKNLINDNKIKIEKKICTLYDCEIIIRTELDTDFPEQGLNNLSVGESVLTDILNKTFALKTPKAPKND